MFVSFGCLLVSVVCLFGGLVVQCLGCLFMYLCRFVCWMFGWWFDCVVVWLSGCLVKWLFGCVMCRCLCYRFGGLDV